MKLYDILTEAVINPEVEMPIAEILYKYNNILKNTNPQDITSNLNSELNPYHIYFGDIELFNRTARELDKAWVPPKGSFAYTNPDTGSILFINLIPSVSIFKAILRHEAVHRGQAERFKSKNPQSNFLTNIKDISSYINNKQELMAYAQSLSDNLKDYYKDRNKILKVIKTKSDPDLRIHLRKLKDDKTRQRFLQYLYQYITKF